MRPRRLWTRPSQSTQFFIFNLFGDYILEVQVPLPKVFFYSRLLPGMLKGENEVVAIGGVYEVRIGTF